MFFADTMFRTVLLVSEHLLFGRGNYRCLTSVRSSLLTSDQHRLQRDSPQMDSEVMWFGMLNNSLRT